MFVFPPGEGFRWLPRWAWGAVVAGLLLIWLVFNYERPPHFDAAWFAEEAWWLVRDGRVRSEFFRGLNGWEQQLFVFHKLFIYVEAAVMCVVGFTPGAAQGIALAGTALGLWGLLRYLRPAPAEYRWLAAVLLLGCGAVLRYGGVGRPESLVMALGFNSFVVLAGGRGTAAPTGQPPGPARLIGAGLLAGAAALTHLNGLIYLVAGAGWLWLRPGRGWGWRPALLFGAVAGSTAALYLLDALAAGRLPTMVTQFQLDPATRQSFAAAHRLTTFARLHTLFFHSEGEAALSALVVLGAFGLRRYGRVTWRQPATRYALLLLAAFAVLTKSATDYYYLLFVPSFIALLMEWLPPAAAVRHPLRLRRIVHVGLAVYVALTVVRAVGLWRQRPLDPPNVVARNAAFARHMPLHDARVIAPLDFFFGQIAHYRIRSLTVYFLLNQDEFGQPLSVESFFALAAHDSVRYVITDERQVNMVFRVPAETPARVGSYRRVWRDAWGALYVRE